MKILQIKKPFENSMLCIQLFTTENRNKLKTYTYTCNLIWMCNITEFLIG